jgi:hypothetical protein
MSKRDGTGPNGQGAMTGKARGNCTGNHGNSKNWKGCGRGGHCNKGNGKGLGRRSRFNFQSNGDNNSDSTS